MIRRTSLDGVNRRRGISVYENSVPRAGSRQRLLLFFSVCTCIKVLLMKKKKKKKTINVLRTVN